MQVFKFGGASIKSAQAVKNVVQIIEKYDSMPLLVVVSAMGKTTRALEGLVNASGIAEYYKKWEEIKGFHFSILQQLFTSSDVVFKEIEALFDELKELSGIKADKVLFHARIVSYGELFSSVILTHYVKKKGLSAQWIYAPDCIITNRMYSEGQVHWELTCEKSKAKIEPLISSNIIITQGYIASCNEGIITLGKEGSDYTAAIFAACLHATKVTIWKDVPGVLDADPKQVANPSQIFELPYSEASEMTYYGASVIHPKTIKPLANANIPLEVRSFDAPEAKPTCISNVAKVQLQPSIIYKHNQCLLSCKVVDYAFIVEEHLALLFKTLHKLNIPVNMMQNSAITISVCFTYSQAKLEALLQNLSDRFTMYYNTGLKLITIKNYTPYALSEYTPPKNSILLEQRTRNNYRALIKEID